MKKIRLIFHLSIFLSLTISACNLPFFATGISTEEKVATSVAQTVAALQPVAVQPTNTPIIPTQQVIPTYTLAPTSTVSFSLPTSTPEPCNKAQLVNETIPDGSTMSAGQTFTKTWSIKNFGTCTWNTNYKLVFSSGDAMSGPASMNLSGSVAPGATVNLTLNLKAPATPGTFYSYWKLQGDDGKDFGTVWVQIKIPGAGFAVTSVTTNLADVRPAVCPHSYAININITASAAGTVTDYTENSLGATSPTKSVIFAAAGTKTEALTWDNLGVDGATTGYWLKVYIDEPNHQWWGTYNFSVTCP